MYMPDTPQEIAAAKAEKEKWVTWLVRIIIVGLFASLVILGIMLVNKENNQSSEHFKRQDQQRRMEYMQCVNETPKTLPANVDAAIFCKTVLGL